MESESNTPPPTKPIVRKLTLVATAFGLWCALVLLFATPIAATSLITWRQAIGAGALFWVHWLLLIPAVAWFSLRFPIERNKVLRNLGIHLLCCLLTVGVSQLAFGAVVRSLASRHDEIRGPSSDEQSAKSSNPLYVFLGLRAALDVLVYGSLVGACQAINNIRRSQERERREADWEARLTRSKLEALRLQLNPHFIFNTLNAISTLIYLDPKAADEMIADLSELLRHSLDGMDEIPLGQELEFIRTYVGIEQQRFGDRLQMEQIVPQELLKALVPSLILQPLVENAIRHGIAPQRGSGLITLEVKQEGNALRLSVRDNGKGFSDGEVGPERHGIGIANIKARLRGHYGGDQQLSFGKVEPHGCQIEIRLPYHTKPSHISGGSGETAA